MQLVDYYSEFEDKHSKVNLACNCIDQKPSYLLSEKMTDIITAIKSMNLKSGAWNTSEIQTQFTNAMSVAEAAINDVKGNIDSTFSDAENTYKKLKEILDDFKNYNDDYIRKFNEEPDLYIQQDGSNTKIYNTAHFDWKKQIQDMESNLLDYKIQVKLMIKKLENINTFGFSLGGGRSNIDAFGTVDLSEYFPDPLALKGNVDDYIILNGLTYKKTTLFGKEYYVLANVRNAEIQEDDVCLGYANSYVKQIVENRKKNVDDSIFYKYPPVLYSTMDKKEALAIIMSELLHGRAVAVEVNGDPTGAKVSVPVIKNGVQTTEEVDQYSRHYITIYGFEAGIDLENIQETNLLALDCADGQVKQLGGEGGTRQRVLANAQGLTSNESDEFYCVNVFGDIKYDELLKNTEDASHGATQGISGNSSVYYNA